MGGAEEHRLEELRSETHKFGEGEGSGRIPPVLYSGRGTGAARAGTGVNPQRSWTGAGTVLPPAARPWECGSPGPVTLWPGTRGWLTGVDRKHPESLSLGGLDGFLGSGTREIAEGGEGHSAGLDVPGRGAPRGPCPGDASIARFLSQSGAGCPFLCGPRHPPRASLSREEEAGFGSLISSYAWRASVACGLKLWPQAP